MKLKKVQDGVAKIVEKHDVLDQASRPVAPKTELTGKELKTFIKGVRVYAKASDKLAQAAAKLAAQFED